MPILMLLGMVCLGGAAYFVGELVTTPARERGSSVRRATSYGRVKAKVGPGQRPFRERVLAPLGERLARWTLRLRPGTNVEAVRARLLAAGLGTAISPTTFLALKSALGLAGVLLGLVFGGAASGAGMGLMAAVVAGGIGFIGPDFVISAKARSRAEAIRAELPDALDLMAVSVEAGMGFDGAIAKLTEHMEGPLADEFALALSEIRIGEARHDALKKLGERTGTRELASFVRAVIQADQLGISLGRILRVQAADSRLKRQAAAEEKAMKAPVKMLFPTALLIFPAMFLVILGPAILNFSKLFS
jgi:tight adherence protein C